MRENSKVPLVSPAVALLLVLSTVLVGGCLSPSGDNQNDNTGVNNNDNMGDNDNENGPSNNPPAANAGIDQVVYSGSLVTLDGSGSSDPDADTLSLNWEQSAGPAVELIGAESATPSFVAPEVDTTLTFTLTVDDGNGSTDSGSVDIVVTVVTPQLFIVNFNGNQVTSYRNPSTLNGNITPDTNLGGAQTLLDQPTDLVINAAGDLLVANARTPSIIGYSNAMVAGGNLQPDSSVQGPGSRLERPSGLAINRSKDLLFVADAQTNQIYVYQQTTNTTFAGEVEPIRTIQTTTTADLNNPQGLCLDINDELYVANQGNNNILIFAGASTLDGDVQPQRIVTSGAITDVLDVFVDASDNMFVVGLGSIQVHIFNNASTLNGNFEPDLAVQIQGAATITAITVDKNGTAYLADFSSSAVHICDDITLPSRAICPNRTIQGENTQLNGPRRLFLIE